MIKYTGECVITGIIFLWVVLIVSFAWLVVDAVKEWKE